jgi:hypothetical protein
VLVFFKTIIFFNFWNNFFYNRFFKFLSKVESVGAAIPTTSVSPNLVKKLRMNEPLIGVNALKYCQDVLESGWISVEGPYVKK